MEDEGKIKVGAETSGKSKLTESEMREMRRKQQEHAASVQRKIDEELRKASSQVESESSADEDEKETEPEAEEEPEEGSEEGQDNRETESVKLPMQKAGKYQSQKLTEDSSDDEESDRVILFCYKV